MIKLDEAQLVMFKANEATFENLGKLSDSGRKDDFINELTKFFEGNKNGVTLSLSFIALLLSNFYEDITLEVHLFYSVPNNLTTAEVSFEADCFIPYVLHDQFTLPGKCPSESKKEVVKFLLNNNKLGEVEKLRSSDPRKWSEKLFYLIQVLSVVNEYKAWDKIKMLTYLQTNSN